MNNMYEKREQAIPFTGQKRLIWTPLGVIALVTIVVPMVFEFALKFIPISNPEDMLNLRTVLSMILTVGVSLVLITKISKIKVKDLGFERKGMAFGILTGALAGLVAISLVALLVWLLGGVTVSNNFSVSALPAILLAMVFFGFQGTFEEIMYRGYLMPHFSKFKGIIFSILFSSVLFTLLHALNPGITVMPIINLFLASVVFSLVFYNWGSLWITGFAHALWNFSQGLIYGSLVSGVSVKGSVLVSLPVEGNTLLSGGNFGLEGSIVTSVLGVILIALLSWKAVGKNRAEKTA